LRQYDAGILIVGDILVSEYNIPPLTESYAIEAECPAICTLTWQNDINVFADMFHMHQIGSMMWSTQSRQGIKMSGFFSRVEFWDFDFQHFPRMSRVIKRGDSLNTHCIYDTSQINTSVPFGPSSSDEMCMEFMAYYPRLLVTDSDGAKNVYGFCGKYRGVFNNVTGPQPNPDRKFATLCGDLQFPNSIKFDSNGNSVNNPVFPDLPGGEIRLFGQLPQECSALAILPPTTSPTFSWQVPVMISLGAVSAVLLLAFFAALFSRTSNPFKNCGQQGYERIDAEDELDLRR